MLSSSIIALAALSTASAHMQMSWPYPLHSTFNPATPESAKDYSMTAPLTTDGLGWPCKGYINNPSGSPYMDSVVSWKAGDSVTAKFAGTASHLGGSCQFSMSYDEGKTWNVIHSHLGGCMTESLSMDVTIPSSAPSGSALFGWTWFNHAGNREMYMNCAAVTIEDGGSGLSGPAPFVANAGVNECATIENIDTVFPDLGDSVSYGGSYSSSKPTTPAGFTGTNCVAPGASSGNGGSGSGSLSSSTVISSSVSSVIASASSSIVATSSVQSSSSASKTGSVDSTQATPSSYAAFSTAEPTATIPSASVESAVITGSAVSSAEPTVSSASTTTASASIATSTSSGRVCRIKKRSTTKWERDLHPGQTLVGRRKNSKPSEHRRSRFGRIGHVGFGSH